jgi:hypothetical protein
LELDPDPDPLARGTDQHQNVTDPQHCSSLFYAFMCEGAEFRQHGGSGGIRARALLLRAATRPHQGPRERGPRQGPTHWALHQVGRGAASKQCCGTGTAGTESN